MKYIFITLIASLFFAVPASAQELFYSNIVDIHKDTVSLRYASPSGDQMHICSVATSECEESDDPLIPQDAKGSNVTLSPHGHRAFEFSADKLSATVYNIQDDELKKHVSLVFNTPPHVARFTRDGSKLVIVHDLEFRVYDLESFDSQTIPYSADSFRNFLVSPNGDYVSYISEGEIRVVSLENGFSAEFPSRDLVYLEISENGDWGAYRERDENGTTLWVVDLRSFPQTTKTAVYETDREVDDYIFFENNLYFTTNGSGESPYEWTLLQYDPMTQTQSITDSPISYQNFMRTAEGALLYHKIDESVSSIYALKSGDVEGTRLMGVEPQPLTREIDRSSVILSGIHGVLLEPEDTSDSEALPLVVWLHGGPMRQTSLSYHSYLSYAVYDELLEKIAENARVLKLDYPGSWGYGKEFMEVLQGGIGVADRIGVENAIEEFTKTYTTNELHLIGNSYGAYLALRYAVEHPDTMESVISISGVTDWRTLTTQIPSSVFTPRFNGTPDLSNEHLYAQTDIIRRLPAIDETRLLVTYGEEDATVPVWQSKLFIPIARAFDIQTDTLVFEDEGHVITKRENLNRLCEAVEDTLEINIDCD